MQFKRALVSQILATTLALGTFACNSNPPVITPVAPTQTQRPVPPSGPAPTPQVQPQAQNSPPLVGTPNSAPPKKKHHKSSDDPLTPLDPNADEHDAGAPPVYTSPVYSDSGTTAPCPLPPRRQKKTYTQPTCTSGCDQPVSPPPCSGCVSQAPTPAAPAIQETAECISLFNSYYDVTRRWTAHYDLKDLKLKIKKKEREALQGDIDVRGRNFSLKAILDGLNSMRRVNPDLACRILKTTSGKTLNFDGPNFKADTTPDGIIFKRHKFLWFGAGRIFLSQTMFESMAVAVGADVVNYTRCTPSLNADAAAAAIFEGYLDFADIKAIDHEKAELTGVGADADAILACDSLAFPVAQIVASGNYQNACLTCARVNPQTRKVDPNFSNPAGEAFCSLPCDQPAAPPAPPCTSGCGQPTPPPAPPPPSPPPPPPAPLPCTCDAGFFWTGPDTGCLAQGCCTDGNAWYPGLNNGQGGCIPVVTAAAPAAPAPSSTPPPCDPGLVSTLQSDGTYQCSASGQ